jgi:hypothetical protein
MPDFTLIDLYSQYHDVLHFVSGMKKDEIINWMKQYGTVSPIEMPINFTAYRFLSHAGVQTAFWFDDNDKIQLRK